MIATYFPTLHDAKGQRFTTTTAGLARRFQTPKIETDKCKLPGISFATFRGDTRALANVEGVSALQFDFDDGTPFDDLVGAWKNDHAFVHTTWSHTPAMQRARLFIFLGRVVTVAEYSRLWRYVAAVSTQAGQRPDPAAKDASRLSFLPGIQPGGEYRFHETKGATFDVDGMLAAIPPEAPRACAPVPKVSLVDRIERARRYLEKCDGAISGSGGHSTTFIVAQKLVRGFELSEEIAFEMLSYHYNPRCEPPWSETELRRKVAEAARAGQMAPGALLDARRTA